jgi:hypothetical protein
MITGISGKPKDKNEYKEQSYTSWGRCTGVFIFRMTNSISAALKDWPPTV